MIPSVISNTNNTQYVSAFRKTYSALSQAMLRLTFDYGGSLQGLCDNDACFRTLFSNYLIGVKSCEISSNTECWHASNKWFYSDGSPISGNENSQSGLIANDGTLMVFLYVDKNCSKDFENLTVAEVCGRIRVDVNGFKLPNTAGKDIFDFYILKNKLVPRGGDNDSSSCPGWGCTGKLIREGAMNY